MVCVDKRLQPLLQNVRINLGRRNVSMAEELLNGPEISTTIEKVARKGVTQNMRRNAICI
jgi:hypothetical protein